MEKLQTILVSFVFNFYCVHFLKPYLGKTSPCPPSLPSLEKRPWKEK